MTLLKSLLCSSLCPLPDDVHGQANAKLAERIDSLYGVDQSVQLDFKKAIENKAPFDSIQKMQAPQTAAFGRHVPLLKKIITDNGYPSIKTAGPDASHRFFVLVQHSDGDPAFQASLLPVLKGLANQGEVRKKDYAFLYDRVQRNMGKQQLYGTQLSFDGKGSLFDGTGKIMLPQGLAESGQR